MTNEPTNCRRCGRELTDPQSIELGIGPICREKSALLSGARLVTGATLCGSHCPQGEGTTNLIPAWKIDAIAQVGLERLPDVDFVVVESYTGYAHHMIYMYARNIGLVGKWNFGEEEHPGGWCAEIANLYSGHNLLSTPTSIEEWWGLYNSSEKIEWTHVDPDWATVYSFYSGPYYSAHNQQGCEPWWLEMMHRDDPKECAWTARAFCFYGCAGSALELIESYDDEPAPFEIHPPGGTEEFGLFWPLWNNAHWDLVVNLRSRIVSWNAPKDESDIFDYAAGMGYFDFDSAYRQLNLDENLLDLEELAASLQEFEEARQEDVCYCGYHENHPEMRECECAPYTVTSDEAGDDLQVEALANT